MTAGTVKDILQRPMLCAMAVVMCADQESTDLKAQRTTHEVDEEYAACFAHSLELLGAKRLATLLKDMVAQFRVRRCHRRHELLSRLGKLLGLRRVGCGIGGTGVQRRPILLIA